MNDMDHFLNGFRIKGTEDGDVNYCLATTIRCLETKIKIVQRIQLLKSKLINKDLISYEEKENPFAGLGGCLIFGRLSDGNNFAIDPFNTDGNALTKDDDEWASFWANRMNSLRSGDGV